MYCSNCGLQMQPGQTVCPQCGRPALAAVPPVPGLALALENYRSKIRALGIVWLVYAGLSLLFGFAGLSFAHAFFMSGGRILPWMQGPMTGPMPPGWMPLLHIAWIFIGIRVLLAGIAAWGLLEHARWGRIFAIIVAILSLIRFPLGTALGIWTLVVLPGYRNAALYEQL